MPVENRSSASATTPGILSPSAATPSKPVVIPTRSPVGPRSKQRDFGRGQAVENKKEFKDVSFNPHDPASLAPSVAALLAMTSIPQRKQKVRPACSEVHYPKQDPVRRRPKYDQPPRHALSSSSMQTWDFLVSPSAFDEIASSSYESFTPHGPLSSICSESTESMPSLETDEESLYSRSSPVTPELAHSSRNDRRLKSLSNIKGEDCVLDHPLLLPPTPDPDLSPADSLDLISPTSSPVTRNRYSLRSNLTASLQVLRSAARSFSNFTVPPLQRDDYLARSLLSNTPQFTDEPRPLPLKQPPDVNLRRYLNPIDLSAAELHFHTARDQMNCKSSIQLQTYYRNVHHSSKSSSPPIFVSRQSRQPAHLSKDSLDVEDALDSSSLPRQREPRENCDFLRIIVLEMRMRKVGKLSETSPGRAKLWLPARTVVQQGSAQPKENSGNTVGEDTVEGRVTWETKVPLRWTSTLA